MMFRRPTIAILFVGALIAPEAKAQCLEPADQAAFERLLARNIRTSDWTYPQLYLHALNRTGFGTMPAKNNALDVRRPDRWNHLARLIATSLRQADRVDTNMDTTLAGLVRDDPREHQHPRAYRFANRTLSRTYTDYRRLRDIEADLRARFASDPSLADEFNAARRTRALTAADIRNTARARRVAHLIGSNNVDLGELIGEFWLNHFNVDSRKTSWSSVPYQKTLRAKQCSTFLQLLRASARHPAMLVYLDNYRSRIGRINENYGRELLELHTLGDDHFRYYDQSDVVGVARALTGWTYRATETTAGTYDVRFKFVPSGHDPARIDLFNSAPRGIPLVLPEISNAAGNATPDAERRGARLLRYLAGHPQTRINICGKLAYWLVGTRNRDVVTGCAADEVWGATGNLGAIYRYLLSHRAMFHSVDDLTPAQASLIPNLLNNKIKTPLELVVSAVRSSRIPRSRWQTIKKIDAFGRSSAELGLAPAGIAPPTGYPDTRGWLSSGYLLRYQEFLYREVDTSFVRIEIAGNPTSGQALEETYRRIATNAQSLPNAERVARLDAWTFRLVRDGLGLRPLADSRVRARRFAYEHPDTLSGSGATQPVRTITHAVLGGPTFIRK